MSPHFESLKPESNKDRFDFVDYLNQLKDNDLYSLVEDIVSEKYLNLNDIFPTSKGVYIEEIAFKALRDLPYATFQKIQNILESIIISAIDKKYSNSDRVIDNVTALTARRRQGLSVPFILDLLNRGDVNNELKTNFGLLLSQLENTVRLSFWDTEIDYVKQPYLIPAFISAYKNVNPSKALEKLIYQWKKPSDYKYYKKSIITSLENILLRDRDFDSFISLNSRMPIWVQQEFNQYLDSQSFSTLRIKEEIELVKQNKKEIRIGISLFPDLLLLLLAQKEGFFYGDKNYYYSIKIEDWNSIFKRLMNEDLDFIIANHEICAEENGITDIFRFIIPLVEYKGFSIIFRRDAPIDDYKHIKRFYSDDEGNIINKLALTKAALCQLKKGNKFKIFASKHTDHYKNLIETLELIGMKSSDVIIISDKEPHEGYELFYNNEVDAIVGGLPQKLLSLKNHGKELFSIVDCDLPFQQVNGLICRNDRYKELEKARYRIIHAWNCIVKEINNNHDKITELANLYNVTQKIHEPNYHPIDETMFKEFWNKTYFLPTTIDEANKLKNDNKRKTKLEDLKKQLSVTK